MRALIFILLFPIKSIGQVSISGKVIDIKTKAIIPYATIGLAKENIGINADENGRFSLTVQKQIANDSLIVSCVGYLTKKIPVKNSKSELTIELLEKIITLNPVTVSTKQKWEFATLNDFRSCGNTGLITNGTQIQSGRHFLAPEENSILTEVRVCVGLGLFHSNKSKFRIRIYDIDSLTGSPSEDLSEQIIDVNSSGKVETVNLEKYNILIPHKDFFVAIEWLKIPFNLERSESKNKIVGDSLWRPHIGITVAKNKNAETWNLYYNNKWSKDNFADLHISATVKY